MRDERQGGLALLNDVLEKLVDLRPGDILIIEAGLSSAAVAFQPGLYRKDYTPLLALIPEEQLKEWANG